MERDEDVRTSCFARLAVLQATFGDELPYAGVHVSSRLLDDDDGPMLDVLKIFHGQELVVPQRRTWKPDRERLAERFARFAAA